MFKRILIRANGKFVVKRGLGIFAEMLDAETGYWWFTSELWDKRVEFSSQVEAFNAASVKRNSEKFVQFV